MVISNQILLQYGFSETSVITTLPISYQNISSYVMCSNQTDTAWGRGVGVSYTNKTINSFKILWAYDTMSDYKPNSPIEYFCIGY